MIFNQKNPETVKYVEVVPLYLTLKNLLCHLHQADQLDDPGPLVSDRIIEYINL